MDLLEAARRSLALPSRPTPAMVAAGSASVVGATLVAAALESWLGVPDASPVYLLAVVVMAAIYGSWAAIATSVVAVLVYDFLFTAPRYTFSVADPQEWLSLLLFLVVAVVIGRLAALQSERAHEANRRAEEAQALFAISRSLATATSVGEAAAEIAERLRLGTGMERVWILTESIGSERVVADTQAGAPRPSLAAPWVLRRHPADRPAEWVRIHEGRRDHRITTSEDLEGYRVAIEAEGEPVGSIWALRRRNSGRPGRGSTRSLALAADQLGLALRREQLRRDAIEVEVARQSDALKTALLDSVSHDLRTPLASIRALAGSLMDPAVDWPLDERRSVARTIDQEAERLGRIVRDLLDLSRVQAGALVPELEVFELRELVRPVVERVRPSLGDRPIEISIPDDLPLVLVDAVMFDEALTNLLDNAVRYAPAPAPVRIAGRPGADGTVELLVEDGGPGVPAEALDHVFEKFYRVPPAVERSRHGLGIGLSVVRGFMEAMHGRAWATRSELGGLAIVLALPAADPGTLGGGEDGEDVDADRAGEVSPRVAPGEQAAHEPSAAPEADR